MMDRMSLQIFDSSSSTCWR
uniref:Uncharacterized protein n=1 Tax=Rhizophora mucronata TaxID=61149 RepID=A0A2P2NYC5_RHIMU